MSELKALRTFLLAAEKRNFAQVAREMDTTPASVTRIIAALEAELGVQLFIRTTRQVSLTTDGAVFAARVEPAVRALDAARREVINAHRSDEGGFGSTRRFRSAIGFCRKFYAISAPYTPRSRSRSR